MMESAPPKAVKSCATYLSVTKSGTLQQHFEDRTNSTELLRQLSDAVDGLIRLSNPYLAQSTKVHEAAGASGEAP